MHAKTTEELVAFGHDGRELVVGCEIFGSDFIVVRQFVLLRAPGFALFATDTEGCVI
jgi:hypothetical protein